MKIINAIINANNPLGQKEGVARWHFHKINFHDKAEEHKTHKNTSQPKKTVYKARQYVPTSSIVSYVKENYTA